MAATTFMSLTLPAVSQTLGPTWATLLNNALTAVDAHDHTLGNGRLVPTAGIGINADLSLAGFNLTNPRALRLGDQGGTLTGALDVGCLYRNGPDLWWNSGGGAAVQITSGGGVAGTPGSIGGLASPAAVTYSSVNTKFTFTSNTSIDAQLDCGPVTIRTMTASAQGVTLQSPTGLAASYALTLFPSLPASTQVVTVTSTGLLGTSTLWAPDGSTIVGSGTLLQAIGVTQSAANSSATIKGNRAAADAGADVVLTGSATRTAGLLLDLQNNGVSKFQVDYLGEIVGSLTLGGTPAVLSGVANSSLTLQGNRAAADAGADVVLTSHNTRTAGSVLQVVNAGGSPATILSLDPLGNLTFTGGVVFDVNDGGLTAGTNWSLSGARLRRRGNWVYFCVTGTSTGSVTTICTIPLGYRPNVAIAVAAWTTNTGGPTLQSCTITTGGAVQVVSAANGDVTTVTGMYLTQ